jgi:hypothetical protein
MVLPADKGNTIMILSINDYNQKIVATILCDQESLHDELEFLRATFRQNGYSNQQIQWAINPLRVALPQRNPSRSPFFPLSA